MPADDEPLLDPDAEQFLLRFLDTPAPSGFEEPAAAVWAERAQLHAHRVSSDRIGNQYAWVAAAGDGGAGSVRRIAIIGHLDEIGLIVSRIDDKGFIKVGSIGGWDPAVLPGQRIRILGTPAGGPVIGSIGRVAVHALDPAARAKLPKLEDLWVDIGAPDRAAASAMVRVGDPAVLEGAPIRIGGPSGSRLMSRCLDDRVGSFVVLEVLRAIAADPVGAEVVAVGSIGEENGTGGAKVATAYLDADRTCVIDVTTPGDTPGASHLGDLELGKGPIVTRGSSLAEPVVAELMAAATDSGIPFQLRGKGVRTATDADQTVRAGRGIATCLVNVPGRYLHTPVEQVDLRDVRATIDLVAAWVRKVAEQ